MGKVVYYTGRFFQLAALLAMPSAIWVGHLGHDERSAIFIFVCSIVIFLIGWLLAQIRL